MAWHARLQVNYALESGRSVPRHSHEGPLRILQSHYPESERTCHDVLVHPPGGLVGGDTLEIRMRVGPGAHALVTTPGASRFYRSEGQAARQHTRIELQPDARLEWLPLEAIYHSGCIAENRLELDLAAGAEVVGWDIAALGLPQAKQPFERGRVHQHLQLHGAWLERGLIDAADTRLMDGPLGLAGRRCLGTLFFAAGSDLPRLRRDSALDAAREVIEAHALARSAGATSPHPRVVVVRVLAPLVEPAWTLLKAIRRAWRPLLWGLPPGEPRGWAL